MLSAERLGAALQMGTQLAVVDQWVKNSLQAGMSQEEVLKGLTLS